MPVRSLKRGDDVRAALAGGEDHSLLATFPAGTVLPGGFRAIGVVRGAGPTGAGVVVAGVGPDAAGGWDPYRAWAGGAG